MPKRGERATHRVRATFDGGRPFVLFSGSLDRAEDAARRQRLVTGPNGETCTATVEPMAKPVTEHRTHVVPTAARHCGPMRGHQWRCTCGRSGKPMPNLEPAESGGIEHVERMARRAARA